MPPTSSNLLSIRENFASHEINADDTFNFKAYMMQIFQPAQENMSGGEVMVKESILDTSDVN